MCIKNIVFCVIFTCFLGIKLRIFRDLKNRVFVLEVLGCFYELKFGYFKRCEVLFLNKRIFVRFAYFCCLESFILQIMLFCEYFVSFVGLYEFKLLFCNVGITDTEVFLGVRVWVVCASLTS